MADQSVGKNDALEAETQLRNMVIGVKKTLHSTLFHRLLRSWQSVQPISSDQIMYPIFLLEEIIAINSMPGISRCTVDMICNHLQPLVEKGLKSVLLFGIVSSIFKDENGSYATAADNPVMRAIPILRTTFPDLVIACDVCLCPYTKHGRCGMLDETGGIDNEASIERITSIALSYAQAGAHIIAPSDMMDGRVIAIKACLKRAGLISTVSVLSTSVEFDSALYGPFRDAANKNPMLCDRKAYQLPSGSAGLAARAAGRDVAEGCDMLMVKPGMMYLDIVRQTKQAHPELPVFVYQVYAEYQMVITSTQDGSLALKDLVEESLIAFKRAGADCIITYFAPLILEWLHNM